jgi:hypothetical protein
MIFKVSQDTVYTCHLQVAGLFIFWLMIAWAAAAEQVMYTVRSVHSTQYSVHSTQYSVHSTQYSVHSTVIVNSKHRTELLYND